MNYEMHRVQDILPGDHILIDGDGSRLKTPIVVRDVDTTTCLHHTHINSLCYDNGTEVGLNAPQVATD